MEVFLVSIVLLWLVLGGAAAVAKTLMGWFTENDGQYTKDWPKISRAYKAKRKYTCEQCRVDLTYSRRLLHVHHRDRNVKNNEERNLAALCVECHSKQDGLGHARLAGAIRSDGRLTALRAVRRRQKRGILYRLCSWLRAFLDMIGL